MAQQWDQTFVELMRGYLPALPEDIPLHEDMSLPALGLDSVGTVGLLADLEDTYDVTFPDESIKPATFSTPGVTWSTLSQLRNAGTPVEVDR